MTTATTIRVCALGDALRALAPIKPHASIPALAGVRITPGKVSATNLEVSGCAPVDGLDLDVLVRGTTLRGIIDSFAPDDDLECVIDGGILRLTSGRAQGELPTMPTTDFPELPEPSSGGPTFSEEQVGELREVCAMASRDDTRPVLMALNLSWSADGAVVAFATDSYRLAVYQTTLAAVAEPGLVQIPAAVFAGAAKGEVTVSCASDGGRVTIERPGLVMVVRTIQGTPPVWQQLFPTAEHEVALGEEGVASIVRLVGSLGDSRRKPIRLSFTPGSADLLVQVVDGDAGVRRECAVTLDEPWTGGTMTIGSEPEYFVSLLEYGRGRIGLLTPLRPMIFNGPPGEGRAGLVMPIRLPDGGAS